MPKLQIRLFGKLRVWRDEDPVKGLDIRRVQELLGYLLLYRHHPYPRETLAGLLWGETSAAQAKKCMRQTLWQLQAALATQDGRDDERLVFSAPDWIQLNANANVWLDVAEFESIFDGVKGQRGEEFNLETVQLVRSGVMLYQGDLLEGWYQDWCIFERERLQNMYLAMLDKLMAYCEAHHEFDTALDYGGQILRYDRAHERTHRRLMSLYYQAGDRAAALRQYQRCTSILEDELGVQPSRSTITLLEHIQADQHEVPAGAPLSDWHVVRQLNTLIQPLLARLRQRSHALADLERQIQEDIELLDTALSHHIK